MLDSDDPAALERLDVGDASRAATFTVTGQGAFVPYDAAGRRVPCAAITVHFLTRTLAEDKDGTPPPSRFKATIDSVRVSCP